MKLLQTRIENLRCFAEIEVEWAAGLTLLTGGNGAGKSSLIEALHLLGYGRSFRGRVRDGLVRSGAPALSVFAAWQDTGGRLRRAGLRHTGASWEGRLDGESVPSLGELCAEFPVLTFEPGSHELIAGGSEARRRFLDWSVFHVEPGLLPVWRRYARALKQRNTLLRQQASPSLFEPWDRELVQSGEILTSAREVQLRRLDQHLHAMAALFLPELGSASLSYQPGWRREAFSLADSLVMQRERDLALGYTGSGPHRADWRIAFEALPGREALSRGQEKLAALACVLAQAKGLVEACGHWPLICLDDLASELDREHQRRALSECLGSGAQVILTGTEPPPGLLEVATPDAWFHVEQGSLLPR